MTCGYKIRLKNRDFGDCFTFVEIRKKNSLSAQHYSKFDQYNTMLPLFIVMLLCAKFNWHAIAVYNFVSNSELGFIEPVK